MKLLITGGCGFLGSNLAAEAIRRRIEPIVFDNLSRLGAEANLAWLETLGCLEFVRGDVRDARAVLRVIDKSRPSVVFHLAGQVAMTSSLADPRLDFEVNAFGSFNVLEAVRTTAPECAVVYSSTNKVYGDLEQFTYEETPTRYRCLERPHGFDENTPLDFHSPYGCSKGAADQYMLDYARMFNLRTTVFRHSSMYGGRQFATVDQGWVGWFVSQALRVADGTENRVSIAGNGKQVRDVLHANDIVDLYFRAAETAEGKPGQVFNVGGGMANSMSLLELFGVLEEQLAVRIPIEQGPARASDQKVFVANISKAKRVFDWEPVVDLDRGIVGMIEWIRSLRKAS